MWLHPISCTGLWHTVLLHLISCAGMWCTVLLQEIGKGSNDFFVRPLDATLTFKTVAR
jgi:hypothetical protein